MANLIKQGENASSDDEAEQVQALAISGHVRNAVSYTHLTLPTNREV